MTRKRKVYTLFVAGDGRDVSSSLIWVNKCEEVRFWSNGWDCDADDYIMPYEIFNMPTDIRCEAPLADMYTETCKIDCCSTIELPVFKMGKNSKRAVIDKPGVYFLFRGCGAEDVTVWYRKSKIQDCCC